MYLGGKGAQKHEQILTEGFDYVLTEIPLAIMVKQSMCRMASGHFSWSKLKNNNH